MIFKVDLWISTNDGYYRKYDGNVIETIPWPIDATYSTNILANIGEQGAMWIYSYTEMGNRLYRYYEGEVNSFSITSADLRSNLIRDILIDQDNHSWVLGNAGFSEFDGLNWDNYAQEIDVPSLYYNDIQQDVEGNIWISVHYNSSEYYTFGKLTELGWEYFQLGGDTFSSSESGEEFFFDHQGVLWGAVTSGIARYDGEEWFIYDETNSVLTNYMREIAPMEDGTFFCANYGNLFYYDGNGFVEVDNPYTIPNSVYILWLYVDQDGFLWVYHSDGIITIYDGNSFIDVSDQFPPDILGGVFDMAQTANGDYWFATCYGLLKYDQDLWAFVPDSDMKGCYTNITVDSFDNIWLGAQVRGVFVYNENGINKTGPPIRACLEGVTYYDFNGNGYYDMQDYRVPSQKVQLLPDSTIKFTSILGNYRFQVPDHSNQTVQVLLDSVNWTLASDSVSYTLELEESCIDSLNFGMNTTQENVGGAADIITGIPRCFQTTPTWIRINNETYLPLSGTLELELDELIGLVSSAPSHSYSDGNIYVWEIDNLPPFGYMNINLEVQYPGTESIGDTVMMNAHLLGENGVLFDSITVEQIILCSYDPNDKSTQSTGPSVANYALIGDALEYLVRFENTGNDTAFKVVIRDTLSPHLDINTFEFLASSHPVDITIRGNLLEFAFDPIYLPYTDIDPIGSHGFVKFRIQPVEHIEDGQTIENKAFIYFDFNPPIITNTTENIFVDELPVISQQEDIQNLDHSCNIVFMPNPVYQLSEMRLPEDLIGGQFVLYNALGDRVRVKRGLKEQFSFQRGELPAGIYFYVFEKNGQTCSGKLILE